MPLVGGRPAARAAGGGAGPPGRGAALGHAGVRRGGRRAGRGGRRARAPAGDRPRGGEPAAQRRAEDRAAARRLARVPHAAHGHPHGRATPSAEGTGARDAAPSCSPCWRRRPRASTAWWRTCWTCRGSRPARWWPGWTGARPPRSSRARSRRRRRCSAGRRWSLDVPDTLPLVRADPVLCERILVNLLHNAVRHGRAAGAGGRARCATGERLEMRGERRRPRPAAAVGARRLRALRRRGRERRHGRRAWPWRGAWPRPRAPAAARARRGRGAVRARRSRWRPRARRCA